MTETIKISPGRFRVKRRQSVRGVDFDVFPSPYDVPEVMTANYNKSTHGFRIIFKYIGQTEFLDKRTFDNGMRFLIGVKSLRINEIHLQLEKGEGSIRTSEGWANAIVESIDRMESEYQLRNPLFNYMIIRKILGGMAREIFGVANRV